MKLRLLFVYAFALFLVSACRPAAAPVSVSDKPVSINDVRGTNLPLPPKKPLPEMMWTIFDGATNADGADQKWGDLKGKAVILDFWATYCPPCLEEIPHLNELQVKYKDAGLVVIGLHVGGIEDRPKVPEFAERLKIGYTLGTPEEDLESFVFSADSSIPQTLILDREGRLVEKIIGYSPEIRKDLDKAVEKALGQ